MKNSTCHLLSTIIAFVMFLSFSSVVVYADSCELPEFDINNFSDPTDIDNPYLPLVPGTIFTYEPVPNEDDVVNTITVLYSSDPNGSKNILGVDCIVVHDEEWVEGVLTEDTYDWYAQDDDGNIWYFGEDTKECLCDYNCTIPACIDTTGSWEAGQYDALPGYLILAPEPKPGACYQQEYAEEAQDRAKVLRLNAKVTLEDGGSFDDCIETKEWTQLDPGNVEHKVYCPDDGLVLIQELKEKTVRVELVDVDSY